MTRKNADPEEDLDVQDQADETADDAEPQRIHSLDALNDKLDTLADSVAKLLRGPRPAARKDDGAADVAAQVRDEVGKIQAAEGRQKAREDRLGSLEAKIKEISERPPREYRRITRILWGEDE